MKNPLNNRFFIALISFALGLASFWSVEHFKIKPHATKVAMDADRDLDFDSYFDKDFFSRSRDPFAEMNHMHQQMLKSFGLEDQNDETFNSWFSNKFGGGVPQDFAVREDDKNVYYEISSQNGELDNVDVKVEHGQVTISGQSKQQSKNGNAMSQMSSNFMRSFPAPPNTDPKGFQVDHKDNKVIVSFPKIAPSKQKPEGAGGSDDKYSI